MSLFLIFTDRQTLLKPVKKPLENLVVLTKSPLYNLRKASDQKPAGYSDEKKIAVLEAEISVLKKENEDMRRLLGTPLPPSWKFLPARVIGQPTRDYLEINRGQAGGVKEGMAVISGNFLIGIVIKSNEHFARVELPSSEEAKILAITRSKPKEGIKSRGLVRGIGKKIIIDKVLLEDELSEGDLVLTMGEENLPADILIGKVSKVVKDESMLYQQAEIDLLSDESTLDNIFVIVSY